MTTIYEIRQTHKMKSVGIEDRYIFVDKKVEKTLTGWKINL